MQKNAFEQRQAFQKGMTYFKRQQYDKALSCFRKAVACENITELRDTDPLYLSYYGIALATARSKFDVAKKLCNIAVSRGKEHPEVFLNLGKVYEVSGNKTMAINTYRAGYREHNTNADLYGALQRLNPRGKSLIPFLDRDHFLNKYSGLLLRRGLRMFNRR
ncbi:tetratricopeptide repeat protein [bacterium]|nr:tetratricopeptide repeat protein [candidate division CSSED10-310 bacterium]